MVNKGVEGVKNQEEVGVFHRPYDSLHQENIFKVSAERQKQIAETVESDSKAKLESWGTGNFEEKNKAETESFEALGSAGNENKENETIKPDESAVYDGQLEEEALKSEEKLESRVDEVGASLPKAKDRDGLEAEYETEVERVMKFKSPREKVLGAWKLTKKLLRERYGREVGDGNAG